MNKQLLLISSSRYQGGDYLAHCASAIKKYLGDMDIQNEQIVFVPFALKDERGYAEKAKQAFGKMGYDAFGSIFSDWNHTECKNYLLQEEIRAIFIGGGNTFRLLNILQEKMLLHIISNLVESKGVKYIGTSAGSNMACPTIMTTNDMPIVELTSFSALDLIPFQINPHFVPGSLVPKHMGETRETRIAEYHEENDLTVVGLPEGNWINVNGEVSTLRGTGDAMIFQKGEEKRLWLCGSEYPG